MGIASPQVWRFFMDNFGDLWCIKAPEADEELAELHLLTKYSNYQNFTYHAHLGVDPDVLQEAFVFMTPARDLLAVQTTGTAQGRTLVHTFSKSSGYRNRSAVADTGIVTQSPADQFVMKHNGDLLYVMRPRENTTLQHTYIAVLSQHSGYERIVAEHTTAFRL
uniref:Uncharacterized protein n=1 Tax=Alexandrium andersonii TaxID=327968 RepID=A0A7S2CP66_9DINO